MFVCLSNSIESINIPRSRVDCRIVPRLEITYFSPSFLMHCNHSPPSYLSPIQTVMQCHYKSL